MSTLAINGHTAVDATAGAVAMTLPTGAAHGDEISVEKYDSSTNAVNITGSIRGVSAQAISLTLYRETIGFRADAAGSWWPVYGHKTKSSIDALITAGVAAAPGVQATVAAAASTALTSAIGGLTSSATRTNLATNPTGVNAGGWTQTTSLYGARTVDTTTVRRPGTQSLKSVRTTTTPSTILTQQSFIGGTTTANATGFPVTPGTSYAVSLYGVCTVASRIQVTVKFWAADGTTQQGATGLTVLTTLVVNTWGRTSAVFVAPALSATLTATGTNLTVSGNSSGGEQTNFQDFMIEPATTVGTYFDGGSGTAGGTSHAWVGTANASASSETTVSLPGYVSTAAAAATYVPQPQAAIDYVRQSAAPVLSSGTCAQNIYTIKFATGTGGSTPDTGTFQLAVTTAAGTQTTSALAWNCTAADIQAALIVLSNVGAGGVTVALSGSQWVATFIAGIAVISMVGINNTTTAGTPYPGTALLVNISAGFNTLYTATAPIALQSVKLTNTSTTAQVIVTFYYVPNGQTATLGTNDVAYHLVIQPLDAVEFVADTFGRYDLGGKVMATGDKMQLTCDRSQILTYSVAGAPAA